MSLLQSGRLFRAKKKMRSNEPWTVGRENSDAEHAGCSVELHVHLRRVSEHHNTRLHTTQGISARSSFPPSLAIVQGRRRTQTVCVRPQLGLHFVGLRRHSSHVPAALELLIRVNNDSIVKLFL